MTDTTDARVRHLIGAALLLWPGLFIVVFLMHFHRIADFTRFRLHYVQVPPERTVSMLINAHNRWPVVHDPHILGYLALPLLPVCAYGLYLLGRTTRPFASALTLFVTVTGTIYLGGVFGMWTAFFRGIGLVDPAYREGAIATFTALTTPQGAFLLTTSLAKLAMLGLAAQVLVLAGTRRVPAWSIACVVVGCALFLAFWDLDNWMLIGDALLLTGFVPMRAALIRPQDELLPRPALTTTA